MSPLFWSPLFSLLRRQIWSGWGGGGLSTQRVVGPGETTWGGGRDAGGELQRLQGSCLAGENRDLGITPRTQEPLSGSREHTPWSPPRSPADS